MEYVWAYYSGIPDDRLAERLFVKPIWHVLVSWTHIVYLILLGTF